MPMETVENTVLIIYVHAIVSLLSIAAHISAKNSLEGSYAEGQRGFSHGSDHQSFLVREAEAHSLRALKMGVFRSKTPVLLSFFLEKFMWLRHTIPH